MENEDIFVDGVHKKLVELGYSEEYVDRVIKACIACENATKEVFDKLKELLNEIIEALQNVEMLSEYKPDHIQEDYKPGARDLPQIGSKMQKRYKHKAKKIKPRARSDLCR